MVQYYLFKPLKTDFISGAEIIQTLFASFWLFVYIGHAVATWDTVDIDFPVPFYLWGFELMVLECYVVCMLWKCRISW